MNGLKEQCARYMGAEMYCRVLGSAAGIGKKVDTSHKTLSVRTLDQNESLSVIGITSNCLDNAKGQSPPLESLQTPLRGRFHLWRRLDRRNDGGRLQDV